MIQVFRCAATAALLLTGSALSVPAQAATTVSTGVASFGYLDFQLGDGNYVASYTSYFKLFYTTLTPSPAPGTPASTYINVNSGVSLFTDEYEYDPTTGAFELIAGYSDGEFISCSLGVLGECAGGGLSKGKFSIKITGDFDGGVAEGFVTGFEAPVNSCATAPMIAGQRCLISSYSFLSAPYVNFDNLEPFSYTLITSNSPIGVPEPASWAMMIAGFGLVGGMARRRATLRVGYR